MNGINIPEIFGTMVFNDKVMKERLPKEAYDAVRLAKDEGKPLSHDYAKVVASVMKDWAIENGATHFTHWFQPMTGITAEKHDSFVEPFGDGDVIMKFSEKSLVKGESDASSFPSGGLRATFEARGYTAWDPTSYAFVKDGSLYIPTAFCSYSGEALDKKTPLLRSMDAFNKQALRILRLFGNDKAKRVTPTVGAEQEYFLIDKSVYERRLDLVHCGRTLFGARPSKGQELEDHYYGAIKSRVSAFMKELDEELWKLGVYAKTKHNEVAPAQHELAPVFTSTNIASDQNQLTMELMKSVANKHDLVCLLHEKPFASVNGSGKHNNWSISTDLGENLLEPGDTPNENAQFLLFLVAVIKAVDEYQDLLRISVASAGNDHRLGADEAPPAIISIYLGEELDAILNSIESGSAYLAKAKSELKIGVSVLPPIPKDSTDRNRTSPFAFTGNKFEFRMVGSSSNIACPNFIINTIVAEELRQFADQLENAKDFNGELDKLIKKTITEHKRILFSGNNYSKEWEKEAQKRGLLNLKSTVDALPHYTDKKNVELFAKHKILSEQEINSRMEILLENYSNIVHIEALTAIDIARKEITPVVIDYQGFLLDELKLKKEYGKIACGLEEKLLLKLSALSENFSNALDKLVEDVEKYDGTSSNLDKAKYCEKILLADMETLRGYADAMELLIGKDFMSFPTYEDILYSVKY
ncbi:MAG: glutamine synthetase III [Clostridia bacterium]|nr:glutamine synthetase III [Clostridia bacterium]MBR2449101.1 glutamine synthetase III [Clostridia bacterium]